ncbi:MAG: alpha/beta hydrolase [Desulfobacteraceae bacterium]|nr:alpha/beta hydrolase [Desulfobacteraceae bacterium]
MNDKSASILDRPEILSILFHPRPAPPAGAPEGAEDIDVQTPDRENISCRFYKTMPESPHILFFHGNGEIAADYDPLGPVYNDYGLNLIVADYRGYGKSTGSPTVETMLSDAHPVLDEILKQKEHEGRTGSLWIMGRSLGSAPALEIAHKRPGDISGLIIESGFASAASLIARLGMDPASIGIDESLVFSNAEKIKHYTGPLLVMHAEHDHIIPLDHGKTLYHACPSTLKDMEIVSGADHNTIMLVAGHGYFRRIRDFINRIF